METGGFGDMVKMDDVRKYIEPALEYSGGTHEWLDIVRGVHDFRMQLWANDKAAAITEIIDFPQKRVLNVFLAGGDMEHLMDMLDSAKAWGKGEGCSEIIMSGRKGWLRVLDKQGWSDKFSVMGCAL